MKTLQNSLMLLACIGISVRAVAQTCDDALIEDRAIVRLASAFVVADAVAALQAREPTLAINVIDEIPSRGIYLFAITGPGGIDELEIEHNYFDPNAPGTMVGDGSDPNRPLIWGELGYNVETAESKTGSGYVSRPAMTATHFAGQYAAGTIGLADAQNRSTGQGAVVAVLDTGIDATHAALQGSVLAGGFNFVLNSTNTDDAGDATDNDGDGVIDEAVGHGTYVAGLIRLVAPDAGIVPVVVLNSDGTTDNFRLTQGLFWAIDRGVEVINVSLGSTYDSTAVEDALDEADAVGITVVGSAGNCNLDQREFPAMKSSVLGVVSVDDADAKSAFSNYNDKAFISVPGSSVPDAGDPTGWDVNRSMFGPVPGSQFAAWEGTSLSTALVSGAAALIRAQHPEWPANELTADMVADAIATNAIDIDPLNPSYAGELGAGRLDLAAAVNAGPVQPDIGDLNNNGGIDIGDLALLLSDFGRVHSSADLNGDGVVNVTDLGMLLNRY
jgi:hypothetical protein